MTNEAATAMSVVGVLVAVFSAWVAHKARGDAKRSAVAAEETASASKLLAEIESVRHKRELTRDSEAAAEKTRAQIRVHFDGRGASRVLVVKNQGQGSARNVRVEPVAAINGHDFSAAPSLLEDAVSLGPDDTRECLFGHGIRMGDGVQYSIRWEDDDGFHDDRQDARFPVR